MDSVVSFTSWAGPATVQVNAVGALGIRYADVRVPIAVHVTDRHPIRDIRGSTEARLREVAPIASIPEHGVRSADVPHHDVLVPILIEVGDGNRKGLAVRATERRGTGGLPACQREGACACGEAIAGTGLPLPPSTGKQPAPYASQTPELPFAPARPALPALCPWVKP